GDRTSSEAAVICSVSQVSCSNGLVRRHQREVSSLSRRMISPEGSILIRPITGRHSLSPSSSTRHPIGAALRRAYPEGRMTGLPRSTDVSRMVKALPVRRWLNSDGRRRGTPCTWPLTFWFKPLSAFGLSVLTTFIGSSLELAMPSTLAPDRPGARSRRVLSRETRPPGSGEVTLSPELRTVG